ncbi:MAG: SDR family NAD(P)-dependent oxidoreductase, partial [Bdellovibrionota bacterium]
MRILITGGSSDIGRAIALRRLKLGDEVVITASSLESLEGAKKSFSDAGFKVDGFVFDLRNPSTCEADLMAALEKGVDSLILNAATRLP